MRWPIRAQILLPFVTVLVVAVVIMAATSSWLAASRSEREVQRQLSNVLATIEHTSLNYTDSILSKMRGLSGAEFVALSSRGHIVAATLSELPPQVRDLTTGPVLTPETQLSEFPTLQIGETRYSVGRVRTTGSAQATTLIVLYPEARWREARWAAAWPPLLVGAVTIVVMGLIAAWLAARIARRVRQVEQLMADLANGQFHSVEVVHPRDELDDLIASANRLAEQLSVLQQTIRRTEQLRLLAQLAGGLAHQLRNCVTGAGMAVQIHQRRCSQTGTATAAGDDSLDVALRQLSLTEEHVKRLLALSRQPDAQTRPGRFVDVMDDVVRLVDPVCQHSHVRLIAMPAESRSERLLSVQISDAEGLRTALLNLVLNAIEAAGSDGEIALSVTLNGSALSLEVSDTGPGPPDSIRETLFEPFVTTKPEGVGLGLSLVKQTIDGLDGSVRWFRHEDRTVFAICLKVTCGAAATNEPEASDLKLRSS